MSIGVRYFAAARERAGCSDERLPVPNPATVQGLLSEIARLHPSLEPLLKYLRVAVNQEFQELTTPVKAGDEVALIPPVSGGAGLFQVLDKPLKLQDVIDAVRGKGQGGFVTFSGTVRDSTKGRRVIRLEYEAYADMAVKKLEEIGAEAQRQWPQVRIAISHRVGSLFPGDDAVVIAASSPHRAEAFAACSFAIEALKRDVPIWKKEFFEDGEVWVGLGP